MSYVNMVMYGAVIPSYNPDAKDKKPEQEQIKADDPNNREKVRKILDSLN